MGDPLSLFLAADARMCAPDYFDDQIWELSLSGGDPPSLAVETMLGLRAHCVRLFPVFVLGHQPIADPDQFASPPVVRCFAPNYIHIACSPYEKIDAESEYWVPGSHELAGRFTVRNNAPESIMGELWLAGILRPSSDGSPWRVQTSGRIASPFLAGKAGNLNPVVVMTGEVSAFRRTYAALKVTFTLAPGEQRGFNWVFAGYPSREESLAHACTLLDIPWEAAIARVELENASLLEIETGHPDWDAVLAFSQVAALQSLIGATPFCAHVSAVIGRTPDRGYSMNGDGSDYPPSWSGVNAMELLPIVSIMALVRPDLAYDIIQRFLELDPPDARPGPGKQRANILCPPVLAQLMERALAGRSDAEFAAGHYDAIRRATEEWYSSRHDRDQDGAPEWERVDSIGPEAPILWAHELPDGGGVNPFEVEMPSLAALLYGECSALARHAQTRGEPDESHAWKQRAESSRQILAHMWGGDQYRTIDRVTHRSTHDRLLWQGTAEKTVRQVTHLNPAARVTLRCLGVEGTRPVIRIILKGKDEHGRHCEEEIHGDNFSWMQGVGCHTTRTVWSELDTLHAESRSPGISYRMEVSNLTREDLTQYLPLWSRAAPLEHAKIMLARLEKEFGCEAGLQFLPTNDPALREGNDAHGQVWMLWNGLMAEAALRYGRDDLAWDWIRRSLDAAAAGLHADRAFRSSYRPEGKGGSGPRNSLRGIFPVGTFLTAVGVLPLSASQVWVGGRSAIPFPVILRYRGMTILRENDRTEVSFPGGQKISANGLERKMIKK